MCPIPTFTSFKRLPARHFNPSPSSRSQLGTTPDPLLRSSPPSQWLGAALLVVTLVLYLYSGVILDERLLFVDVAVARTRGTEGGKGYILLAEGVLAAPCVATLRGG